MAISKSEAGSSKTGSQDTRLEPLPFVAAELLAGGRVPLHPGFAALIFDHE